MIERIVVLCQTRTESLRWVEILRQQIKCARTTSSLQQHHHPLPPPHVSLTPPFLLLTYWIRNALEEGRLSLDTIQQLTQEWPDHLEINSESVKLRKFKTEVYIDDYKRDAVIDQEIDVINEEDNPYGYIRYISESSSADEITILLPTPNVSSVDSEYSSEASTVQNSMEDLSENNQPSKKLPFVAYDDFKTCSLMEETKSLDSEERQLSCPPVIKNSQESLFFIDKTPSKESLALPYCPPIQVDYEDFASVAANDWAVIVTDQALQNHQSELVILPVEDEFDRPIASPVIPLATSNYVSAQNIFIQESNDAFAMNKLDCQEPKLMKYYHEIDGSAKTQCFQPKSISCQPWNNSESLNYPYQASSNQMHFQPSISMPSQAKNDSIDYDRPQKYCVEVKARISPPKTKTPDLLKNLGGTKPKLKEIKCKPYICFSKTLSSEEEYRPLDGDLDSEHEVPMSSLSKDTLEEEHEPSFKNGIYAHWFMKASIEDEEGTLI